MNVRVVGVLILILSLLGGMFGFAQYMKGGGEQGQREPTAQQGGASDAMGGAKGAGGGVAQSASNGGGEEVMASEDLQQIDHKEELDELSKRYLSDIKSDHRLNLKMATQLRSYENFLNYLKSYAKEVERDLKILEQISKDSFQEDVKLQASLFAGKKPEVVATHLEKFRSSRVGAILAKMKDKEASKVLDIWAIEQDPRVNLFYQEVMVSYLKNKRYDTHPELLEEFRKRNQEIAELPKP